MPTIILYAVEIAEMEAWVGARDARLLREAKQIVREDPEAGWDESELSVLDRLLGRMIQEGRLYEGLDESESYYLTQLLIDLFDELIESESVSEEIPLGALDLSLGQLGASDAIQNARRWLTQGRLLGTDRLVWDRSAEIEDRLPYFGYVRHAELAPLAAAADAAASSALPPRRTPRTRAPAGLLKQVATACREAMETERDLLSFVS
jgi:hypothetical protein